MKYESENPLFGIPLGFFPRNLGKVRNENGEIFHQDILAMEKRYQGKRTSGMLTDYCWTLKRDVPEANDRRKSYASTFLQVSFCLFH
jgi:hypothetical protein